MASITHRKNVHKSLCSQPHCTGDFAGAAVFPLMYPAVAQRRRWMNSATAEIT